MDLSKSYEFLPPDKVLDRIHEHHDHDHRKDHIYDCVQAVQN